MLSSISWQHYLTAIFIITSVYYLYIVLKYYQKEISDIITRQPRTAEIFGNVTSPVGTIMGEAKPDNGVTVSETENMQFAEVLPDEPYEANLMLNDVAITQSDPSTDLVAEAGNLIDAFKDVDNKQEFITLVNILLSSYKRFQEQIDLPAALSQVAEMSTNKLKFTVALSDFKSTWS